MCLSGGENEKPDSFCRTTKDWAELNPDLAERRITPGCLGDFFLRGGTGYNKTIPFGVFNTPPPSEEKIKGIY